MIKGIYKNTRIKTKIMASFLLMSLIGIALGITGMFAIMTLTQMSDELEKLQIGSNNVLSVVNAHYEWRHNLTIAVLTNTIFTGSVDPYTCALGRWLNEYSESITDEKILSLLNDIYVPHRFIHVEAEKILQLSNENEARAYLLEHLLPETQEVITILHQINNRYNELVGNKTNEIIVTGKELTALIVSFVAIAVIAGILLSLLIPPAISRPLNILSSRMQKAASGDFTVRLPQGYGAEIGQLFASCNTLLENNNMAISNLKHTTMLIRESAEKMLSISSKMAENSSALNEQTSSVNSVTEEFSAGMSESSSSLTKASSNISGVASSIEEIDSTISTIATTAEQTREVAMQSSTLVDNIKNSISKASGSVSQVSERFNNVAKSVDEINKSISVVSERCAVTGNKMTDADKKAKNTGTIIKELEASSRQIGKIVNIISDIADQTNMLSLNAAIEAAGAGLAGKGFMVVANEVKELAKETAGATDDITHQIEDMQKKMNEAVSAVSEITKAVNDITEGVKVIIREIEQQSKRSDLIANDSAAAAERMSEIAQEISRISDNAISVTSTVLGSSTGSIEIANAIAELVIGTREIAMNAERASIDIKEIDRTTQEMTTGLLDISRHIHHISNGAQDIQNSADSTKLSSEELLKTASNMEEFVSKFKIGNSRV